MNDPFPLPRVAAVFGASGGIGAAMVAELARRGVETIHAGSRSGRVDAQRGIVPFAFDLLDEASIAAAADGMRPDPPGLVLVATGALTLDSGKGPEKSWRALDPAAMAQSFALNAVGPALIARHMLPLFAKDRRAVFAALSARVGSIGDNRLGGWHSYRAGKAALNMLLKTLAIELARTHPQAVIAALHPGTVATPLSASFRANVPPGKLFTPATSAAHLLDVIGTLGPQQSGGLFAWDGAPIPW
jgi:NAD(P)-dependent dehydrogenase (short-subunit alcohol dehydrogenase family)